MYVRFIPRVFELFVLLGQAPVHVLSHCSDLELRTLHLGFLLLQSCFSLLQRRLQLVAFHLELLASLVDLMHASAALTEPLCQVLNLIYTSCYISRASAIMAITKNLFRGCFLPSLLSFFYFPFFLPSISFYLFSRPWNGRICGPLLVPQERRTTLTPATNAFLVYSEPGNMSGGCKCPIFLKQNCKK